MSSVSDFPRARSSDHGLHRAAWPFLRIGRVELEPILEVDVVLLRACQIFGIFGDLGQREDSAPLVLNALAPPSLAPRADHRWIGLDGVVALATFMVRDLGCGQRTADTETSSPGRRRWSLLTSSTPCRSPARLRWLSTWSILRLSLALRPYRFLSACPALVPAIATSTSTDRSTRSNSGERRIHLPAGRHNTDRRPLDPRRSMHAVRPEQRPCRSWRCGPYSRGSSSRRRCHRPLQRPRAQTGRATDSQALGP